MAVDGEGFQPQDIPHHRLVRERSGSSNVLSRDALDGQTGKILKKGTSKGNFLPRNRQGRPWFAQGTGLQVPQAGKEVRTIPSCCIPVLAQAPTEGFPARWLLLTSSPGGHSDSRGGRWEAAEKPKSSEKAFSFPLRRNPGSASTQFKDVSLPASLKPEPFPPRHVSLAVFPLFSSFCFFFIFFFPLLLLPLFLLCFGNDLSQDGLQGCHPAVTQQQQPQKCEEMTGWSCSVDG